MLNLFKSISPADNLIMMKSARIANEKLPNWQCRVCARENRSFARFCGSCGLPCEELSHGNTSSTIISRLKSFLNHSRKKAMLTALGVSLATISIFGIHELSATATTGSRVNWSQVRSFVSKAYRLTNAELDALFARIIKENPEPQTSVAINQLLELEAAVKARLRDNRVELFPNPFFSKPLRVIQSPGQPPFVFADVPLDHPAYKALTPLLDIGLTCADQNSCLRPYEEISRQDWAATIEKFLSLLAVNSPDLNHYLKQKTGQQPMSNFELNDFFNLLRRKFSLPEKETFAWASDPYFPGRLEGLAALSSLIREID